ncbi:MAG TPA: GPW/gp25 family protein [Actinomycetota bacterium]|nr:GPW/gp25 family protein [Actinomycetota bacterium]
MTEQFVGAGWSFPLRTTAGGNVLLVRGEREIEEAMRLILGTARMERPMRPEFGCGIHDYVFHAVNPTTLGRIAHEVRAALERWEPRVDLVDVTATADDDEQEIVHIRVAYSIKGSNDPRNLVFPFYVIPHEEGAA